MATALQPPPVVPQPQTNLADDVLEEKVRFFTEFLDADYGEGEYKAEIRKMLASNESRLIVNIDHLRDYNKEHTDGMLTAPNEYLPAFDKALKDVALSLNVPATMSMSHNELPENRLFFIGLRGSFGDHHVNPRSLRASHLGKLVCLEGIVTRCSLVRPKVARSVHYCEETKLFHKREYRDATTTGSGMPTGVTYPTKDESGNPLQTEFGLCQYRDNQTVSIQEMPERAPPGQLPRSVDITFSDDLVDKCKPGDRVQIIGIYRPVGAKAQGGASSTFRTILIANNVQLIGGKSGGITQPLITDGDVRNITKLAKKKNVVDLLARSLAPSIYGHDYIKKAVLLLLLGGMEKNLANGTHIRGDINMMMVGDPSTAKSQILRFILNIAPLAIATTGRGSSGVGLTAAVTTDKDTGERRLEAGAMVLADRGVVCIDEFDKMSDVDRVAIHEVMEQQTVTIAKAGIHTSLNARCSVIAAANPIYGQYNVAKKPSQNIALPDSLISRFDLLFTVLDQIDEQRDRQLSTHVLSMHRYRPPGTEEGAPIIETLDQHITMQAEEEENIRDSPVFEKFDRFLHAGIAASGRGRNVDARREIVSNEFIKKYIHYAKSRIKPVLTKASADIIVEKFAELRNEELPNNKFATQPITARTLESMVRLATAHAKARLSSRVEKKDAEVAYEIIKNALFRDVDGMPKRTKKPKLNKGYASGSDSEQSDSEDDDDEHGRAARPPPTPRTTRQQASAAKDKGKGKQVMYDEEEDDSPPLIRRQRGATSMSAQQSQSLSQNSMGGLSDLMEATDESQSQSQQAGSSLSSGAGSSSTTLSSSRLKIFKARLVRLFNTRTFEDDNVHIDELLPKMNEVLSAGDRFGKQEAEAALNTMQNENQIMYTGDGLVVRICI